MRHVKAIWSAGAALILCLVAAGLVSNVDAIREVTPTPPPTTQADATQEAATPAPTPGTLDEQLSTAYSLFEAGNYQKAVDAATAIIATNPDASEAYLLRGISYQQLNNINRAIDDFTRSIRILPYDWTAYSFRASAYAQSGKDGEALNDYDKAIELNPRYAPAYTGRSVLLDARGNSQDAQIDQLIAEGITDMQREDFVSAITILTEAIEVKQTPDAHVATAYYNRALAHYSLKELDAAIKDYTSALGLDAQMHDSYLARGIAYRETEKTAEAGVDFAKRMELLGTTITDDTLEIGVSQEVQMAYGQVYRFTFEGKKGQRLTFLASDISLVGVDPLLALLDPNGTPIAGDDDSGGKFDSELANFELPADGTYTLLVSHANGGYAGLVSVFVQKP